MLLFSSSLFRNWHSWGTRPWAAILNGARAGNKLRIKARFACAVLIVDRRAATSLREVYLLLLLVNHPEQRTIPSLFVTHRRDVSVNSRVSSSTLTAENPRVGENDSTFVPVFVSITDTCLTISWVNSRKEGEKIAKGFLPPPAQLVPFQREQRRYTCWRRVYSSTVCQIPAASRPLRHRPIPHYSSLCILSLSLAVSCFKSIRENRSASRACHHCDLSCIDVMDNESFSDLLGSTGTPPRPALLSLSLSRFLSGSESQTSTIEPHYSTNICGDGEERKKMANANRSFFKTHTVLLMICLWSVILKIV